MSINVDIALLCIAWIMLTLIGIPISTMLIKAIYPFFSLAIRIICLYVWSNWIINI